MALVSTAPAARAQSDMLSGFQIGASGGVAIPVSDLGDIANTGYNIGVLVGVHPAYSPVGVRLEAAYNQFGFQGGGGNVNIPAFTGNLTLGLPMGMLSPYAIGGAGLYRTGAEFNGAGSTSSENHFGWNVGGGIKLPLSTSFETFVEARYNRVNVNGGGNLSFVPITFGVMF